VRASCNPVGDREDMMRILDGMVGRERKGKEERAIYLKARGWGPKPSSRVFYVILVFKDSKRWVSTWKWVHESSQSIL